MEYQNYPSWIKLKSFRKSNYEKILKLIQDKNLYTVCIEANCPNRYECFSKGIATFMILGDTCTRNCKYCNIKKGVPKKVDEQEPKRIAESVKKLKLNYVIITCVTRDDLEDGGAEHFVNTVKEIRRKNPGCKIELLISDLNANWDALDNIIKINPEVINHNIEVVRSLFPKLRPEGDYKLSLKFLKKIKKTNSKIKPKSGFMLGFGETESEILETLKDLKRSGCEIVTIGQYLSPSSRHAKVEKYYTPAEFENIKKQAISLGIKKVIAGPLVRSSYMAEEAIK